MVRRMFLVWVVCLAASGVVLAASSPDHTAEFTLADFLEVPTLLSPVVSPDGRQVAWRETLRDLEDDSRVTRLWLGEVKTTEVLDHESISAQ